MQFPDDIGFGTGSSSSSKDGSSGGSGTTLAEQSMRLSTFLQNATQVVEALLEENLAGDFGTSTRSRAAATAASTLSSAQSTIGSSHALVKGRKLTGLCDEATADYALYSRPPLTGTPPLSQM